MTKHRIDSSEVMDMKSERNMILALLPALAMAVLILDAKTALAGAQSGLELCIRVVVPSLFPFLFLSVMVTGSLMGRNIPMLRPLGMLCRIPKGAESLLAVGLLGGYPVGAQSIAQAYKDGVLTEEDARRMLGFCSNAGPSFIFGMLAGVLDPAVLWVLWGIHILSALLTGMLLPGGSNKPVNVSHASGLSPADSLERSLKVIATICGWVIVFRVLLTFLQRWLLWLLPIEAEIAISGLLELTNGCCRLQLADTEGLRFILATMLLGFGGICVCLQTISVTKGLGTGLYFPGKLIQTGISLVLSLLAQTMLFPAQEQVTIDPLVITFCTLPVMVAVAMKIMKNRSSNLARQDV